MTAGDLSGAYQAIELMLGWGGGWMPVFSAKDGRSGTFWHRCGEPWSARSLEAMARGSDERWSHEVSVGLPQRERWNGVTFSSVLWCRIEGSEQQARARAFKPRPSLVLQEGSSTRRLLVWALGERVDWFCAQDLSRRLAFRFGAVQKWADPDGLRVPCPGTFLREGRSRPVPVVVSRCVPDVWSAREVAGWLPAPPEVRFENGQVVVERARRVPA